MLPGMAPIVAGGEPPIFSLSLVGTRTGSNTTINHGSLSAGAIAAGDLGVIFNYARHNDTTPPALVTPSGYTVHQNTGATEARGVISSKILLGSETTVSGLDATSADPIERWILAVFRPSIPILTRTWNSGNGQATTNNPTAQTIAAAAETNLPILLVGQMGAHASGGLSIDPRTTSPAMNEIAGAATNHYAHWLQYGIGDTPADVTYDMDDEFFQVIQSGYFDFTTS